VNEEGGIYKESFHLTWAKNMGFQGRKSHEKLLFSQVLGRPVHRAMRLVHVPSNLRSLAPFGMRQEL